MVVVCALSLVACSEGNQPRAVASGPPAPQPASPGVTGTPKVTTKDVLVKKLRVPWGIAFLPDGSALVTERDSRKILKLTKGPGEDGAYTTSQVGMIEEADSHGEGGLMGIAVSPNYAQDQAIYLYYTTETDNRVARWSIGGKPQPIVTGIPISGIHNGGRLAFGPDKFLYATTGDAGSTGLAQDLNSLGGKILRMTTDGKPASGNPFNTLVWSYGHRNVQGVAWDGSGRMWASEFGQNTWDEINLIEKGKNYGWPDVEGAAGDKRFVDPVFAFPTSESSCSGTAVGGDILAVACLRGQRLILVHLGTGGALSQPNPQLVKEYGRLRAVVEAPDKSLWVLTNNHDGRCNSGCDVHSDDDRIVQIGRA
ncbi:MAG TPA: glucose sorbosone dehydrogenase, partial [Micromonosporaceae bacterium]|nr:glucose sorbosone dehydrogenase [Micromonosporaceae bacterium]